MKLLPKQNEQRGAIVVPAMYGTRLALLVGKGSGFPLNLTAVKTDNTLDEFYPGQILVMRASQMVQGKIGPDEMAIGLPIMVDGVEYREVDPGEIAGIVYDPRPDNGVLPIENFTVPAEFDVKQTPILEIN